jgi:chromosome segregation ATPase
MDNAAPSGFSSYVSFGKGKGFGFHKDGPARRLCLGVVTVCVAGVDLEGLMGWVTQFHNKLDSRQADLDRQNIELHGIKADLDAKEKDLGSREEQVTKTKEALEVRRVELERIHVEKLEALTRDYPGKEELEKSEAEAKAKLKDVQEELEEAKGEIGGYEAEVSELEDKVDALEAQNEKFKKACQAAAEVMEEIE